MAISLVSLSNTFLQWVTSFNLAATEINNIEGADYTKSNGALRITSSGTGLFVANTANVSSLNIDKDLRTSGNNATLGTLSVTGTGSVNNLTLTENMVSFSTGTPKVDSYIAVNRSPDNNAHIRWSETNKWWESRNITTGGYNQIITRENSASTSANGIVQLNDTIVSTSTTMAATANSVKAVIDSLTPSITLAYNTALSANTNVTTVLNAVPPAYNQANTANTNAATAQNTAVAAYNKANSTLVLGNTTLYIGSSNTNLTGINYFTANNISVANTITANTMTGKVYYETQAVATISAGTLTIDCSKANIFKVNLNSNISNTSGIYFTNIPPANTAYSCTLAFTANGTSKTITWGSAVKWASASAPSMTATNGSTDVFVLTTWSAGSEWFAFKSGLDLR